MILPELIRLLIDRRLENRLGRPVAIGDVDLNLITGRARISNLVISSKDQAQPFLFLPALDLHFSPRTLFQKKEVVIDSLVAKGPKLYLERTASREWKVPKRRLPYSNGRRNGTGGRFKFKNLNGLDALKAQITLVDRTTDPAATTIVEEADLTFRFQPQKPGHVQVNLDGMMAGSAPVKLHGWFTRWNLPRRYNFEGVIEDYELSRLNPYAKKYVGHYIRRGRVTIKFRYRYNTGNLYALHEITIKKAQVSPALANNFKEEVGIPLRLALAILEDANGAIQLRILVQGNVSKPEFQVGGIVWKSVRNGILKSLVAPLRLLGHIVTLGGTITEVKINPVGFKSGSLTFDSQANTRLQRLVKFLQSRPKVDIELKGRASRQESQALAQRRTRGNRVTEQDLRSLAEGRVRLVEKTLIQRGIKSKRLFVVTGDPRSVTGQGNGRVVFRLLD
jgi:outer membrane protein OmpA-like peptidoglycan-associated protein